MQLMLISPKVVFLRLSHICYGSVEHSPRIDRVRLGYLLGMNMEEFGRCYAIHHIFIKVPYLMFFRSRQYP